MVISRGTTPTFEFKFPQEISAYTKVQIAFAQNKSNIFEKEKGDLTLVTGTTTTYSLTLTESEINQFEDGVFECQIRVTKNGKVAASKIYQGRIVDVLNDTELSEV